MWALVSGAGIRVGRAIAIELARAGYDLVLHANRSPIDDVADAVRTLGRQALCFTADFTSTDAVKRFAAEVRTAVPQLAVLVNSAATFGDVAFADVTEAQFEHMHAINLRAPFFLTQALLPSLHGGCIVNISDMAVTKPYKKKSEFSHYVITKAAIEALTRTWASELGPHIRVNAVAPGAVLLPVTATQAEREALRTDVPLGREGTPEDVARAVVFLAREPYITGQVLRVDGGMSVT